MMYCPDCGHKCELIFDCSSFPLYQCPICKDMWMWLGDERAYALFDSWEYLDNYVKELIEKRDPTLAARLKEEAKGPVDVKQ